MNIHRMSHSRMTNASIRMKDERYSTQLPGDDIEPTNVP